MKTSAAALILLLALAAHAGEGEMTPAARKHKNSGSVFLVQEKYDAAIKEFEAGFAADPQPSLLYELAQACALAGKPAKAAAALRRYLELSPEIAEREEIEDEIKALDSRAAALGVPAQPRAVVMRPTAPPDEREPKPADKPATAPPRARSQRGQGAGRVKPESPQPDPATPTARAEAPPRPQATVATPAPEPDLPLLVSRRGQELELSDAPRGPGAPARALSPEAAPAAHDKTSWLPWVGAGLGLSVAVVVGLALAGGSKARPEPAYTVDGR